MHRRRSHEKACGGGGGDFWDVISTLTQDLTKARNQLARLMKQVKPRLYGGGRPPLQPIFTPPCTRNGFNLPPNCHRTPPPGHFMCGKEYPHYKSPPSPERPRPVASSQSCQSGAPPPRKRASWSFEQPLPQPKMAPYSCYAMPEPVDAAPEEECERDCIRISFNPRPRPQRCCCTCGSRPARLQGGGGGGKRCLGTEFAPLLHDVTSQLRERRLNSTPVDAELSNRTSCS